MSQTGASGLISTVGYSSVISSYSVSIFIYLCIRPPPRTQNQQLQGHSLIELGVMAILEVSIIHTSVMMRVSPLTIGYTRDAGRLFHR